MIKFVAVCSSKVRAQASIVPCDNHTAPPGRLLLIVTVFHSEASLFTDIFQELAVFVFAYAANIDCRVCGEDILWNNNCQHSDLTQLWQKSYLGTTGSILCCSTGNELGIVVLQ